MFLFVLWQMYGHVYGHVWTPKGQRPQEHWIGSNSILKPQLAETSCTRQHTFAIVIVNVKSYELMQR